MVIDYRDNELLAMWCHVKGPRNVKTKLLPGYSRFGHRHLQNWIRQLAFHTALAARAALDHGLDLCIETQPPVAFSQLPFHLDHAWMSGMGHGQDFVPQALWQNNVAITLQDAAIVLELRMNMEVRQYVSRDFSFVQPTALNEMDYSLQNVITASRGLNVCHTDAMWAHLPNQVVAVLVVQRGTRTG